MKEGIVEAAVIGHIWSGTMTLFIDSKIRSALLHIFLGLWNTSFCYANLLKTFYYNSFINMWIKKNAFHSRCTKIFMKLLPKCIAMRDPHHFTEVIRPNQFVLPLIGYKLICLVLIILLISSVVLPSVPIKWIETTQNCSDLQRLETPLILN